jgi:hypothetical protein
MVGWRHLVYKHNVTTCHCLTVFGQAVRMGWRAGLKALLLRRLRSSGTGGTVRNVADRGAAVLARALPAVACRRKRGCVPRREIGRTYHVKGLTTVPSSVKRDGGSQWVFPRTNPHLMRSNLRRAPRPQRWKRGLARRAVRERGESVRMVAGVGRVFEAPAAWRWTLLEPGGTGCCRQSIALRLAAWPLPPIAAVPIGDAARRSAIINW